MKTSSKESLYKDVAYLTSVRPFRNYENLVSLNKVSGYIANELRDVGYEIQNQKWMANGEEYHNLIASYKPENSSRLIVGAHYDVCGDQPGADDNASAVAGLLETARLVARNEPQLPFGIDFVSYCLEEPPFFGTESMGSYVHAKSLKDRGVLVLGMICYEMIGYFSDEPGSQSYPIPAMEQLYPDKGNFIVVVGIEKYRNFALEFFENMSTQSGIDVQKIIFQDENGLASLSDHMNYWQFGFPAIMINDTSFLRNPHYHEVTDTIDTLDFDKMKEVVNCTYKGILGLGK